MTGFQSSQMVQDFVQHYMTLSPAYGFVIQCRQVVSVFDRFPTHNREGINFDFGNLRQKEAKGCKTTVHGKQKPAFWLGGVYKSL